MTETRHYHNDATQAEKREVLRNDTYLARQQNAADDAGGRYAKLTPASITGANPSPQYPQLPESSPWAHGFDTNVEPVLGFAVDEGTPNEIQTSSTLKPPEVNALPASVEVREPAVSVVSPLSTQAAGSSIKRRGFGE